LALRHSYVYHVLRFLKSGEATTANDLLRLLAEERENMRLTEGRNLVGPQTVEQMETVLAELADIGVVPVSRDDEVSSGSEPPSPMVQSDDGGEGGEGDGPTGPIGPENGAGGVGLAEILGHSVLFCLSDDAQDALLDAAFGIGTSEEGVQG